MVVSAAAAAMTPAQKAAEARRLKEEQEQADLELAKAAFGVDDKKEEATSIDSAKPSSKADFEAFSKLLKTKIQSYSDSAHYPFLLESLIRDLCLPIDTDDCKKLVSTLNVIINEKAKLEKPKAGKKKIAAKKAGIKAGKDNTLDDFLVDDGGRDMDDMF